MEWTHINEGLPKVPGGIPDTCNIRVLAIIKEEVIPDHIDQPNWRYDIKVVKYNRKYGFSEDVVYWTYISNVPELEHLPIKLKNISNKEDLRIKIEIDNSGSEMIFKMLDKLKKCPYSERMILNYDIIFKDRNPSVGTLVID